jgi:hypothetical protein
MKSTAPVTSNRTIQLICENLRNLWKDSPHGKAKRARTVTQPKGANCPGRDTKSEGQDAAPFPGATARTRQETGSGNEALIQVIEHLSALTAKIEAALAVRPEMSITHRAELRVLSAMSENDLRKFATEHGWRHVRRIGGRQIEFYNDASARIRDL